VGLDVFILLEKPMLFAAFENSIIIHISTLLDEVGDVDVTIQMFRFCPLPPNLKKHNNTQSPMS
jgi:hypothetical protein